MNEFNTRQNLGFARLFCALWLIALSTLLAVGFVMVEYFFAGMPSGGQAVCLTAFGVVFFIMSQKFYQARRYLKQCLDEL